jgi:hypothetical protein
MKIVTALVGIALLCGSATHAADTDRHSARSFHEKCAHMFNYPTDAIYKSYSAVYSMGYCSGALSEPL